MTSLRRSENNVGVTRADGGVEGLDRVLPARGAGGLNDDRVVDIEQPAGREFVDLSFLKKIVQLLEIIRLRIRPLDRQPIAQDPESA